MEKGLRVEENISECKNRKKQDVLSFFFFTENGSKNYFLVVAVWEVYKWRERVGEHRLLSNAHETMLTRQCDCLLSVQQ